MKDPHGLLELTVSKEHAGKSLDQALERLVEGVSKSRWQKLVRRGFVRLGGKIVTRSNVAVKAGDRIQVDAPEIVEAHAGPAILHVDDAILVIDKPAGMLVHATERQRSGTLAGLVAPRFGPLPVGMGEHRPGVVHRLDRDTSGVIVLARSEEAMAHLRLQFRSREIEKTYLALVHGSPEAEVGSVRLALRPDRDHPDLQRIAAAGEGREAETDYEVLERFASASLVCCRPRTGRRHQIRVHLKSIGAPVIADPLYRPARGEPSPEPPVTLRRLALHALRLGFNHPGTGRRVEFDAPLHTDMLELLERLRSS